MDNPVDKCGMKSVEKLQYKDPCKLSTVSTLLTTDIFHKEKFLKIV